MKSFAKRTISSLDLRGKALFLRVDFNVPLKEGRVQEDSRIRAALPTIRHAVQAGARVVLASHLGRPGGEARPELSLAPVAEHLSSVLPGPVGFVSACVGGPVREAVASLNPGEILLLENLRFHAGETRNAPEFVEALSGWAEEYVNDAFGTAHRAHASVVGVPRRLGRGAAGLLMARELEYLSRVVHEPRRPVVALLGGAKVSDKIDVIRNLLGLADTVLIGGGMAFTFLKAIGRPVGRSILEEDKLEVARELLQRAREQGRELKLPLDVVVADRCEAGAATRVVDRDGISENQMGLDIGPQTVRSYREAMAGAGTIVWNGPMGVFEIPEFSSGTLEMARAVASSGALSVVGGGDSVAAVVQSGVQDEISHLSTGGGAALEFLAGRTLPGVEVLTDQGAG